MNFRIAASILAIAVNGSWTIAKEIRNEMEDVAKPKDSLPRKMPPKNGRFLHNQATGDMVESKEEQDQDLKEVDIGILSFEADGTESQHPPLQQEEGKDNFYRRLYSVKTYDTATSCQGYWACYHRLGTPDYFVVGKYTCVGESSCREAGAHGYFNAAAGGFSCWQDAACRYAATQGGRAVIGTQSCNGVESCYRAGYYGSVDIQDWSCIGPSACSDAGHGVYSNITIASDSCIGEKACNFESTIKLTVTIGHGSCKCNGCCSKLKAGSVIGDCQCNSLSDNCGNQASAVNKPGSACDSAPS